MYHHLWFIQWVGAVASSARILNIVYTLLTELFIINANLTYCIEIYSENVKRTQWLKGTWNTMKHCSQPSSLQELCVVCICQHIHSWRTEDCFRLPLSTQSLVYGEDKPLGQGSAYFYLPREHTADGECFRMVPLIDSTIEGSTYTRVTFFMMKK